MPDAIKERPIKFFAPMVRAILDGRKVQTRRVVKPQPTNEVAAVFGDFRYGKPLHERPCPFGVPGDRLWVKEAWAHCKLGRDICDEFYSQSVKLGEGDHFAYRADDDDSCFIGPWCPAITMPREACRLVLEITDVRVERLQDISEEDVKAEGIQTLPLQDTKDPSAWWQSAPGEHQARSAKQSFALLWDSIAKPGEKWDDNPWVWVISFRKAYHA